MRKCIAYLSYYVTNAEWGSGIWICVVQAGGITFKFSKNEKHFVKRKERLQLLCGTPDIVSQHTGGGVLQ